MNHTTGAQRRNKKYDAIWEKYHQIRAANKDLLPSCSDYAHYLQEAVKKFKIEMNEARSKYGQFNYGQWRELLGV